MALERDEINKIAKETAENVLVECRQCALNTIDSLAAYDLFEDTLRFYSKAGIDDTSLEQLETLRVELTRRIFKTLDACGIPPDSPLAKIRGELGRATNVEEMNWAIQNFEGALYQSLKESTPGKEQGGIEAMESLLDTLSDVCRTSTTEVANRLLDKDIRSWDGFKCEVLKTSNPGTPSGAGPGGVRPEWRYIPTVKDTDLNEGMMLVDQSGDRWLIKAIDKTGVPARWAYTLENPTTKQGWIRSFTEVERYLKMELEVLRADFGGTAVNNTVTGERYFYDNGWKIVEEIGKPGKRITDTELIQNLDQAVKSFQEAKPPAVQTPEVTPAAVEGVAGEEFPVAGDIVSGLVVRQDIPNQASIESSLEEYEILPGIREVPTSETGEITQPKFYSVEQEETTKKLAEEIKASGEINPLIVVIYDKGDYILEGSHRLDALRLLGIKSFPAQVVIDRRVV